MKNILLLFTALLVVVVVVSAQETKPKAELLTSTVWKLKSEKMSGVGTHVSLSEDTKLTFTTDGKWKSSQPIDGATEGTWKLSDKNLSMTIGSETKKYDLVLLSSAQLQYKIKNKTATYSFEWSSE